jgi:formic-like protein
MNSSKRGPVYGFKLSSLEIVIVVCLLLLFFFFSSFFYRLIAIVDCFKLTDTRTHDKRLTLLHFIAQTIEERFPDVFHFDHDLQAMEKAAQGMSSLFIMHR